MKKTIKLYELAKKVMEYNGENTKPENVHKFCKKVEKTPQVYINFCQERNLI